MKFAIIDPATSTPNVRTLDAKELREALLEAGLKPGEVDHGIVKPGLAIVVAEHSLFISPSQQKYFALNHRLYGGPAVIYAFDERGRTIDFPEGLSLDPFILWLPTQASVEAAITGGVVVRPRIACGETVIWQSPAPAPSDEDRARLVQAMAKNGTVVIDNDTVITTEHNEETRH